MALKVFVLATAGISAFALAGCVGSSGGQPPAWFAERVAEEEGDYPSLREVPRTTIANTDQAHWAAAEQQMMQAAAELRSHPRAQPGPPTDPNVFLQEARSALEATRRSHEPAPARAEPAPAPEAPAPQAPPIDGQ